MEQVLFIFSMIFATLGCSLSVVGINTKNNIVKTIGIIILTAGIICSVMPSFF